MAEEFDRAFDYDWLTHRWAKLLADREAQYADHVFPLSVIGAGGFELYRWVHEYAEFWKKQAAKQPEAMPHAENAQVFGEHVRGITEQYQICYIELDKDLEVDKVCDIFTQINSRGVRLDVFDLINALLKPKGLGLKQLWREAAPRLSFVETDKMDVYILQVMSILLQAYCSPKYLYFLLPGQEKPVRDADGTRRKEILIPNIKEFGKRWGEAVDGLADAIKRLRHPQEFGAISSKYLPYVSILPVFCALRIQVKALPAERQLDAQRKVRHWYWASVFTNRYSGSVESTSARDFLDVKAWFDDDAVEPALIEEFKFRFRKLELRKETKSGTAVYNGIFNLLVLQGARDWMSGHAPQHDDLDDHHIVPSSWGTKHLKEGAVHTILNRTPLTAETNRKVIRERLPNVYLPELITNSGEAIVRSILETHFISSAGFDILLRKPFTSDDFEAFITERQRTLQEAIENLLIKERLDLPLNLRELDEAIERTERALRELIATATDGDLAQLPQHVLQKVGERIQRAAKKNAAFDVSFYQTMAGKLEYCDLGEIRDVLTGKASWPRFEPRFVNKETLVAKFDQLAELRNGIRHSRTVDAITRMEGEAALEWFDRILGTKAHHA